MATPHPALVARFAAGAALTLALGASGTLALAQDGPYDDAIEARQSMFQLFSWNSSKLSDMAKEEVPYDADVATATAENLHAVAGLDHDGLWPEGSDSESEGNATNRSLPAIWDDYPDFNEKFAALEEATASLTTSAGSGVDELKGALNDVNGACKACHDDYRAERK